MAEHGECSSSLKPCDQKVWAKLVSSDSRYSDVEIRSNEMVICSEVTTSSPDKHEWCKITRNSDLCSAMIQNQSLYSILVDKAVVHSKDDVVIRCGDEIIAGPDREGYLRYKFEVMPTQEACNKKMKICIEVEHAKCSICLNIWHDVVTVAPCLHNFCNGCFSEWLRRCQLKHSAVLCPQCRAVVQYVGRNHFLHNIEEDILEADELLKRTDEELALLDSYASIRSSLVIRSGKRLPRKRVRLPADEDSPSDEQSYSTEFPCPQCDSEIRGFQCNWNTVHLQCQACGGMMPSRTGISVPQHCLGCDRAFCGAYWHAQSIGTSDSHLICGHDSFKPISERTITRIPFVAHERNLHEQDITARCIGHMGRTLQDVISDWIAKLNNREIDRTRLPLNNAEMITAGTHFCSDCYDKLVSFLLYWFRISIPRYHLPPEASSREDCWYGYTCRTQHHSAEHARKRNHVCRPTRGSNM